MNIKLTTLLLIAFGFAMGITFNQFMTIRHDTQENSEYADIIDIFESTQP